jgi:4'-phosphopantetheinyl transferase EntD
MRTANIYPTHAIASATASEFGEYPQLSMDADHRASRLAARRAIRALVGGPVAISVERRPGGPPLARAGDASVTLSLAHRDGLAVAIAAPAGSRVGIDLERLDDVPPEHVRYFLTARERRLADLLPGAVLWAMKEAAWKALALTDDVPLTALELNVDGRAMLRGVWLRGEARRAAAALMSPWPAYVGAAVMVGEAV